MKPVTWEFVRDADGTYSVYRDGELLGRSMAERWFAEEICVRWGFCGSEYVEISRQIESNGHATIALYG
jgi:hypothetical protein